MPTQGYANHVYRPLATTVAGVFTFTALVIFISVALQDAWLLPLGLILLSCGVLMLVVMSRTYTVRLQNRIIRLEMQVRLARLGRERDLERLTVPQIVALRFASDAELPALIDRAVADSLTPDAIKRAVRDWQGDYLRT